MSKLTDLANKLLRDHGTVAAATKPFMTAVQADATLLTELAQAYLTVLAGKTKHTRQRTGPHRRPKKKASSKLPTEQQSKAAVAVAARAAKSLLDTRKLRDGRVLGDVPFFELQRLASTHVRIGADFVGRGFEDFVDGVACHLISQHAVPANPDARVRDVIKANEIATIYKEAQRITARKLAEETRRLANTFLVEEEPSPTAQLQ